MLDLGIVGDFSYTCNAYSREDASRHHLVSRFIRYVAGIELRPSIPARPVDVLQYFIVANLKDKHART
jgi:hypothetical protein